MVEIIITDPKKSYSRNDVTFNNEFLITTLTVKELDDVICGKQYNLYVDDKKVENE
jgi:hypothetical protein